MWQQIINNLYQLWIWLIYEASVHPFLFAGNRDCHRIRLGLV